MSSDETGAPATDRVAPIFVRHPLWEDLLALLLGTAMVALGITFYSHAQLLTGGTVGVAFLLSYLSDWSFGPLFFLVNLPFYALAIWRMGWKFTLRTACAVGLVSLYAELMPNWVQFARLDVVYAALFGGFAMGVGLLMLFRHRASLGGVNILALYIQGVSACARQGADGYRRADRARCGIGGAAGSGAALGARRGGAESGAGNQPPCDRYTGVS